MKRVSLMAAWALLALQGLIVAQESKGVDRYEEAATLDATTRAPAEEEVEKRELPFSVRAQGQVVVSVTRGGAAESAGIMKDDVILKFGTNKVFSQDDIADYLRVQEPKDGVTLKIQRAKTNKRENVVVRLGAKKVKGSETPQLKWQFASLGQLPGSLKAARSQKKLVMVGLSGAET